MFLSIYFIAILIDLVIGFNLTFLTPEYQYSDNVQDEFVTKCYTGEVGCFYTGPPWYHPLYRPISVPPADDIRVLYLLYTQKNPKQFYNLSKNKSSLEGSSYRFGKEVKVLIHGFQGHYKSFLGVKDSLLQYEDFNVIVIDWSHNNQPPYFQAVSNARVVAATIALFLKFLMKETGLMAENIHIVGHSLGGEVSGLIGQRIKGIGRITGLDPAGPYFHNTPNNVHIDASDVNYVDLIHTNAGPTLYTGAGLLQPVGHADFFPNGGTHQAGCGTESLLNLTVEGEHSFNYCSHGRAISLFHYSIQSCKYKANACFTYEGFKAGLCDKTNETNRMGFHSIKPSPFRLKYYLDTAGTAPFCEIKH